MVAYETCRLMWTTDPCESRLRLFPPLAGHQDEALLCGEETFA